MGKISGPVKPKALVRLSAVLARQAPGKSASNATQIVKTRRTTFSTGAAPCHRPVSLARLFPNKMSCNAARVRRMPMLPEVDSLPGAQGHTTAHDGYGKIDGREGGAHVC